MLLPFRYEFLHVCLSFCSNLERNFLICSAAQILLMPMVLQSPVYILLRLWVSCVVAEISIKKTENSNQKLMRCHWNKMDLFLMVIFLLQYFSTDQNTQAWTWTSLNTVFTQLFSIPYPIPYLHVVICAVFIINRILRTVDCWIDRNFAWTLALFSILGVLSLIRHSIRIVWGFTRNKTI